ncbi:hypothetical protein MPNT_70003 [Candidatus Methylacidithermus pantelleriae]|uniref:Uncharacterized protein n=1 Tax=Candidatus Methylacidithermus pantelleriae TaxID=2744239 RepID=A0A8J2BLW4_9BACT|nr:hypothetical protein MPNT_70003 [Candidatus Methylacidithermus pantelleriae]
MIFSALGTSRRVTAPTKSETLVRKREGFAVELPLRAGREWVAGVWSVEPPSRFPRDAPSCRNGRDRHKQGSSPLGRNGRLR